MLYTLIEAKKPRTALEYLGSQHAAKKRISDKAIHLDSISRHQYSIHITNKG